jgi:DNA-binding beta-propeller fold protein YncE
MMTLVRRLTPPLLLALSFVLAAGSWTAAQLAGGSGTVFVTERQLGSVSAFDAATGAVDWTSPVGVAPIGVTQPHGTEKVYTSDEGSRQMSVLDRATGESRGTIAMGPLPHHLMASRNGAFIWLTGRQAMIGTMPDTLQLTNDGQTLVVTLRGTPAQISLLDTESFVPRIVNIPGHRTTGHHWLSPNGKYTFVAVESPGGLAVVDNETGAVVADYPYPNPLAATRPHGVFYQPRVLADEEEGQ